MKNDMNEMLENSPHKRENFQRCNRRYNEQQGHRAKKMEPQS